MYDKYSQAWYFYHIMSTNKKIVLGLGIIILFFILFKNQGGVSANSSILERVRDTKIIRVGYAAYPPYVVKDLKTEELSGYYVDIMNEMSARGGLKVEWVETTWQTFISDIKTGKIDLINDPIYTSIPRLQEVNFVSPLGYFNGVAGLTKQGDYRFYKISDLNKKGITVAVPQEWTAEEYARKNLPLATLKVLPGDTAAAVFADMLSGNSDIALADGGSVKQYLEQNPNQYVKALFLDNPPQLAPAGWVVKKGDTEWLLFLNGAVQSMRDDGTLKNLAKKYHLYSYDLVTKFEPQ